MPNCSSDMQKRLKEMISDVTLKSSSFQLLEHFFVDLYWLTIFLDIICSDSLLFFLK